MKISTLCDKYGGSQLFTQHRTDRFDKNQVWLHHYKPVADDPNSYIVLHQLCVDDVWLSSNVLDLGVFYPNHTLCPDAPESMRSSRVFDYPGSWVLQIDSNLELWAFILNNELNNEQ
jgi:hypothetical protein